MRQLTFLIVFLTANCFAQEYISPLLKQSFGIHHHTNRDVAYWSQTDSGLNTIITATTERDSTFNDIQLIKLDSNLAEIWKKRISLDTEQSYDTPLATFVDSNNDIYSVGRSYITLGSGGSGTSKTVITKISSEGEELWSNDLGEAGYIDSFLDEDGLHLVYVAYPGAIQTWHFLTINTNGEVINEFQRTDITDSGNSNFSGFYTKAYYEDGYYYIVYRRDNYTTSPSGFYEHFIIKLNASGRETYPLNAFINIEDAEMFYKQEFQKDANGNMYITYPSGDGDKYYALKISNTGEMGYFKTSSSRRRFLKSFLNSDSNLCVLNNRKSGGLWSLNMVEYSTEGNALNNIVTSSTETDALKILKDTTILVYCNGSFKLYDQDLNLINQFSSFYPELNDFSKTDNNHMVVVNSLESPMYPESNQRAQIDVYAGLLSPDQLLSSYTFSGEGTSYCGAQKLLVDNDSNYIVIAREVLGESNYSVGGTVAPDTAFIYKYDTGFNLLWSMEMPFDTFLQNVEISKSLVLPDNSIIINVPDVVNPTLIKITPEGNIVFEVPTVRAEHIYFDQDNNINIVDTMENPGNEDNTIIYTYSSTDGSLLGTVTLPAVAYLTSYNDNSGNSYVYTYKVNVYSSESKKIRIYKNLVMQSEIPLNISGSSAGISTPVFDQNGTMFIEASYYSQSQLFKITPDGLFSVIQIPSELNGLNLFNSGKIFTCHTNGLVRIYNPDLTLFSSNTFDSDDAPKLLPVGNLMLSKIQYSDDTVRVFNENAELLPEAKIMGTLEPQYARGYADGKLVIAGSFGTQLYTYEEYAWHRGFLHKYDINQYFGLGTNEESFTHNQVNVYPNPSNSFINITGTGDAMVLNTEIYDLTGKLLLTSNKEMMDISSLSPAIYIARISTSEGIVSQKIIKK